MSSSNGWSRFTFILAVITTECIVWCSASKLKGLESDSWGTEFIFVFPPSNNKMKEAVVHVITMDKSFTERKVSIEMPEVSGKGSSAKVTRKWYNTTITREFRHEIKNAVLDDLNDGLHMLVDVRIRLIVSVKAQVFAQTTDSSGAMDFFTVYPVGMGGNYYAFSLPAPEADGTISLFFLPLGTANATTWQNDAVHNVSITVNRQNQLSKLTQTMQAESLWCYTARGAEPLSVWIRDELIVLNNAESSQEMQLPTARLLIVASIRKLKGTAVVDHTCHMPTSMIVDQCALLTTPDFHPMHKRFENVLITAPTHLCPPEPIFVNTSSSHSMTFSAKWDETATQFSMSKYSGNKETFITQSATTIMNILHVGRPLGAFIHEIPSYSQWVNGDSVLVLPKTESGGEGAILIIADDYGREATIEDYEYPDFELIQDLSPEISLFKYIKSTYRGNMTYRVGIDQELGGRYITFAFSYGTKYSTGYVAAVNPHKIPPPIFKQPSTTTGNWTTTESRTTTVPPVISTTTTVTTTQGASFVALSTNAFAICICFIIFGESEQRPLM